MKNNKNENFTLFIVRHLNKNKKYLKCKVLLLLLFRQIYLMIHASLILREHHSVLELHNKEKKKLNKILFRFVLFCFVLFFCCLTLVILLVLQLARAMYQKCGRIVSLTITSYELDCCKFKSYFFSVTFLDFWIFVRSLTKPFAITH